MSLALAVGTSLLGSGFPSPAERVGVSTQRGEVALLDTGDYLVLQRHGLDAYRAPHAIDHGANMLALAERGVDRVLAVSSVGALKREIGVGTLLAPHDFIALDQRATLHDDDRGHLVPGLDAEWRSAVLGAWAGGDAELRDGGVYRQMPGPRFETPSEVRLLAEHADVVGMTMASECVIAAELGIRYAAVCTVDNLANGLGERELSREEFETGVVATRERLLPELERVVGELLAWG